MTSDGCRAYQIGGHYRGVGFRVTVWLVYGRRPYVRRIDIDGMAPLKSPSFEVPAGTVNQALDMGFRRACDTIAAG
jgi:hypothetical protein